MVLPAQQVQEPKPKATREDLMHIQSHSNYGSLKERQNSVIDVRLLDVEFHFDPNSDQLTLENKQAEENKQKFIDFYGQVLKHK